VATLTERLGSVGLELHPDKTKSCTARTRRAAGTTSTPASTSSATPFGPPGQRQTGVLRDQEVMPLTRELPTGHESKAKKAKGKQIRDWHLNRRSFTTCLVSPGHQCPGPRLDQLLRVFYRSEFVLHRTAHRPAPGPVGHAEIQAIEREASAAWNWLVAARQQRPRLFVHCTFSRSRPADLQERMN